MAFLRSLAVLLVFASACAGSGSGEEGDQVVGSTGTAPESLSEEKELANEEGTRSGEVWVFDPGNWDEIPDWWQDVEGVPFHLLIDQRSQVVETPASDPEAAELRLGGRSLLWAIPEDWFEQCGLLACVYASDAENLNARGPADWFEQCGSLGCGGGPASAYIETRGFVVGWGGDKGRVWNPEGPEFGELVSGKPFTYVEGETQPFECVADENRSDPETVDLYPEPWLVACVGTIGEFTVARVEMFRLNESCQPYGNSYGAWISWEHAHRHNIDEFVELLSVQMLADSIECVTLETLLAQNFAHWWQLEGSYWPASVWVTELQRRIGAEPDGIYGPQTRDLHVRAVKDQTPVPSLPFISMGPCGIFKLDISKWPSEDLISQLDDNNNWVPVESSLVSPLSDREPWWHSGLGEKHEEPVPPPMPEVNTIDATGDGVDDFILRFSGGNDSVAWVATTHKNGPDCLWRYVDGNPVRLGAVNHDYWDVGGKLQSDSQGNWCYMNMAYARYDSENDHYEPTMCAVYPPWDWDD